MPQSTVNCLIIRQLWSILSAEHGTDLRLISLEYPLTVNFLSQLRINFEGRASAPP